MTSAAYPVTLTGVGTAAGGGDAGSPCRAAQAFSTRT